MENILQNKVALVTGAGAGIGRAVAHSFAANGAKVVVSDINETSGIETVEQIVEKGGQALFFRADTSVANESEALVNAAVTQYGGLHIACNNAGIGGAEANIGDYNPQDWDKVISINLSGVFYGMRYQLPAMLKSGGGSIVNMGSVMGQVAFAGHGAYVAAKHGVIGLTRSAALEYAQKGIRINTVGPGFVETDLIKNLPQEIVAMLAGLHPIGRMAQPEEVAELVLWLSSEKASFVTGSYYPIDGGYLAR
jgi:NAD(P)-dependent dehydrogenase (short-subunit alcohol dehydrogenase family)